MASLAAFFPLAAAIPSFSCTAPCQKSFLSAFITSTRSFERMSAIETLASFKSLSKTRWVSWSTGGS